MTMIQPGSIDSSDGGTVLVFEVGEQFLQGAGFVQGGIQAGMLADAMARAVGDDASRVEVLDVGFIRFARAGRMKAMATVVHRGKRLWHLHAELRDADDRLVATARGTRRVDGAKT